MLFSKLVMVVMNDSVLITNTTKESIEQIKEKITSYYNMDFSLLEKLFNPIEDLF